jgi:nucleoid-associated protein YejK
VHEWKPSAYQRDNDVHNNDARELSLTVARMQLEVAEPVQVQELVEEVPVVEKVEFVHMTQQEAVHL